MITQREKAIEELKKLIEFLESSDSAKILVRDEYFWIGRGKSAFLAFYDADNPGIQRPKRRIVRFVYGGHNGEDFGTYREGK